MARSLPLNVRHLTRGRTQPAIHRLIASFLIDERTGLPNHRAFRLAYATRTRRRRPVAVLMLDLRGFGRYNERRGGLLRGNELLANFAQVLRASLKRDDFVARWALGDEFVVIANGVTTLEALEQLRARLEGPFAVRWGRRRRLVRCYVAGIIATNLTLPNVEKILNERLRRVKAAAKAADKN